MHHSTNRLIKETSPYLLQHAHNPVDWYPWGEEALAKAISEDKPILVSIGYSACHWCHVMERESFENEETANLMNELFVNIKIDREERPDLDHIYMDAVQAMSGGGGWPLNVFLTPGKKPFYGGTYFPPVKAFNRSSWTDVLLSVSNAFREKRTEIDAQADNLTAHLEKANSFGLQVNPDPDSLFSPKKLDETADNIMQQADRLWGGFGKAPKFPQTLTVQFLLRYHHWNHGSGAEPDDHGFLKQALLSLDRMMEGGIYDQVGGGFARYSTDTEWLAPHFEKMLYDNALLLAAMAEAYQLTGDERYARVIHETIGFVRRELMDHTKGFYAALDADSEGEEGRFYVWRKEEVRSLLGNDTDLFCAYYDITEKGNWSEGHDTVKKSILRVLQPAASFAAERSIALEELEGLLERGRTILLEEREKRVRPGLDDKMILGWNALMNTALSKCYAATGFEEYRLLAEENMEFMLKRFAVGGSEELFHTWKDDVAKYPAFLDDYAFLIQAIWHLSEITGNTDWLEKARQLVSFVWSQFSEEETGFFYYTKLGQADVIVRKKEVYDGAVPSGNSVMAENLYHLGMIFDLPDWKERAVRMVSSLGLATTKYPTSFSGWNKLLLEMVAGTAEIAILGHDIEEIHRQILREFIPNRILMVSSTSREDYPLLAGKKVEKEPAIYLCKDFSCRQPVNSFNSFISLIDRDQRRN